MTTKRRSGERPETATVIRTYAEFRELVANFANGNISLLAIVGRPGLSKSKSIEMATEDQHCLLIKGRTSPLSLYTSLYQYQDRPIVIDDADSVMGDRLAREYIKALTETDLHKRIAWLTKTKILEQEGVPSYFYTGSSVCIITNKWNSDDAIYNALESRAEFVFFDPDWGALYEECANWFWDQEIFDYIHERLHFLKQPDARLLVKASGRKQARMSSLSWQRLIDDYCDDKDGVLLRQLLADRSYANNTRRCEEWCNQTGKERSAFYERKAKIERFAPVGRVPRLKLANKRRPTSQRPPDGYLAESC